MLNRLLPLGALGVILWLIFWGLPGFRLSSLALFRPAAHGVHAPFDDSWQAESFRAGEGSDLGALGIKTCTPLKPFATRIATRFPSNFFAIGPSPPLRFSFRRDRRAGGPWAP